MENDNSLKFQNKTEKGLAEELAENLLSNEDNLFDNISPPELTKHPSLNKTGILCPKLEQNKKLKGHLGQATLLIEDLEESEIQESNPEIMSGGRWKPKNCIARYKVAIIIPYRDRKSHLLRLLDFLFPILMKQYLDFRFINGEDLFNKGRIMNAAFHVAEKMGMDCVIFHDVDMFPQDDRSPYGCPDTPRHLGAFEIVGGALAIRTEDYQKVNGFSNSYWAWGGEDDDMGNFILEKYSILKGNEFYHKISLLKGQMGTLFAIQC